MGEETQGVGSSAGRVGLVSSGLVAPAPIDVRASDDSGSSSFWMTVGAFAAAAAALLLLLRRGRAERVEGRGLRERFRLLELPIRELVPARLPSRGYSRADAFSLLAGGTAVVATAGVTGCGGEERFGSDGIPPLSGEDASLPNTIRNRFDGCYPPDQGMVILLDGRGAIYGNPPSAPADGGSAVAIDRESLCFGDEECGVGGTADGGADAGSSSNRFRVVGRWASTPLEFFTQNPGDPGYGLMAQRTAARGNGDPLSSLRRSGMSGSWGDQHPDYASSLGLLYLIDGEFNPDDCSLAVRIRGAVRTADGGQSGPMEQVAVSLYTPANGRTRVATANFGNENVVVMSQPIEVSLAHPNQANDAGDLFGAPATVCNGGCVTEPGGTLQTLQARLVASPFSENAGPGDAGMDGAADAGSHNDADAGGIPPLPGPDAGAGGGG